MHAQRSLRFLAEQHKALANGTLAKRLIGKTTGHRPATYFLFFSVFLLLYIPNLWTWQLI